MFEEVEVVDLQTLAAILNGSMSCYTSRKQALVEHKFYLKTCRIGNPIEILDCLM